MLRVLQESYQKPNDTMNTASVELKTGMGVVKKFASKTVGLPTAETGVNIFLLDKERQSTTLAHAVMPNTSDWDTDYNTYAIGEFTKLNPPDDGDRFASDQFVASALTPDKFISVGTDGKWKLATAGLDSIFVSGGIYKELGKELVIINVMSSVGKN